MLGVKLPKKVKPQKRALTNDEIFKILSASLNLKEKAFVQVLLYTGMRRGEILALTKKDIDFKDKNAVVNKAVFAKGNQYELKNTPKTDAGFRTIPLPESVLKTLKEYMKENEHILLFPSASGKLMSQTAFKHFWEHIIKTIEKESSTSEHLKSVNINNDITPHLFRHTYATILYYSGIDIKTAQYLLGHSSIQVTECAVKPLPLGMGI